MNHVIHHDLNLVDIQESAARDPEIAAPSMEQLKGLKLFDSVVICNGCKQFWVRIVSKQENGGFIGRIMENIDCPETGYGFFDAIYFEEKHVYAIRWK